MRRYLTLALALLLAAISVNALALGLGEIRLNSWLNQRLDAEIELVSATADELESLQVRLADPAAYERYGLERTAELNTLQFRVVRRPNGTAYLHVTSSEAIREPFLTFLVEASWSRGRLLREYTVLLDPPTFADREPAEEAASVPSPAVVAEPEQPATSQRETTVGGEAARVAETPVEEAQRGDVISIPPLEADARTESREIRRFEDEQPGTYGPIQRNENLWSIAMRLRPDDSVSINQMMIALYRANPEAFVGNINRLKAGYILRVPEYAEVTGLSRAEAFREAQRHNQEWEDLRRGGASQGVVERRAEAEPELSLVVPEEDIYAESDVDAAGAEGQEQGFDAADSESADAQGGEGELDLGLEDDVPSRLLEVEDEALQALQQQDELAPEAPVTEEEALDAEAGLEEETASEAVEPLSGTGDVTPGEEAIDEAPEQALAEDGQAEDAQAEAATAQPETEVVPPVIPRQPEPSLVEKIRDFVLSPLGLGVVAAIIALVLAGLLVARRRKEAAPDSADDETQVWVEHDDDETATTVVAEEFDTTASVAETDVEDEPVAIIEPEPVEETPANDYTDTVVGAHVVSLDENDPMSEADFHVAYGLFDQAADVLEQALEREPSRREWIAKLAEVHFAGNNTDGFMAAARRLRELAGPGDADWDNVAIMARQIAPGDELFEEGGSASSVDLDFDASALDSEPDQEEEAVEQRDDDALDFDLDIPSSEEAPVSQETSEAGDFDLDFELPEQAAPAADEPTAVTGTDLDIELDEPQAESSASTRTEDSEFDLDLGEFETSAEEGGTPAFDDADTQTEFDKALEELSAYVDTNLPAGESGEESEAAELNLDEFNFDDSAGEEDFAEDLAEEEEGDIGEIGTKLDLARAYIDMGDPDGARGILDEVLAEGDDSQKREARELLEQLG